MSGLEVTNVWRAYGLRGDPFFQEGLKASPEAEFPVQTLVVGRRAELARIGRAIGGSDPSRTIVEGEAGVGKTSFANARPTCTSIRAATSRSRVASPNIAPAVDARLLHLGHPEPTLHRRPLPCQGVERGVRAIF